MKTGRQAEFPEFVFDDAHSNPDFAAVVRQAVNRFDFADLEMYQQSTYKIMREKGDSVAFSTLRAEMGAVPPEHPHYAYAKIADIGCVLNTGELIFAKIPERDQQRFFPLNDFRILLDGTRIVVQCSSLVPVKALKGTFYHSRFRPTVQFEARKYVVGFTAAVVKKILRRLHFNRMNHAGLGDVYAYFELCNHFEPCEVRGDLERRDELLEAITFYDECVKRFWHYRYVEKILGARFDPAKGKPYYRVGYCPVVLDGGFALALSFLPPGFKKTPEYTAIRRSSVPFDERRRLMGMATDEQALSRLIENDDFSAIRSFHTNGVPQVVQTHEEWFRPYEV